MKRLALCLSTFLLLLGAIPAQAAILTYRTLLEGLNEEPPNESRGSGTATVIIDDVANTMSIGFSWAGLTSSTTAAHIHCCTTEPFTGTSIPATMVPSFPDFPTDNRFSGLYEASFDLLDPATYNPDFLTASGGSVAEAEAAFLAGIASGRSYLNIHTELFPAGEIRGFLRPPPDGGTVPEPGSIALFSLGAAGLALLQRRRHVPAKA
ncbi:CHRD domain-containing protein [Massilia niastensis]|uniref:CHRD domain-containing protein n=1 Tax=Massilia niastensis TaxID=544911 RepID=UPI0005937D9E|nr:CHRD domain-containing protein [Massilia niastensis]